MNIAQAHEAWLRHASTDALMRAYQRMASRGIPALDIRAELERRFRS